MEIVCSWACVRRVCAVAFALGLGGAQGAASAQKAMFNAGISDPVNTVLAWREWPPPPLSRAASSA
jgi:hypothetical protein